MLSDAERERREQLYRDGCAESIRTDPAMRAAAISACSMCDDDGYRGVVVCDHVDHTTESLNGRAEAARVLADIAARRASRARESIDGSGS